MAAPRASHARPVLLLGLLVAAAFAALAAAGAFTTLDRQTLDLRFRHARLHEVRLDPRIAHVDIDDAAIANFGRWPWPRSRLALALDELARGGARAVALDLLLDDPQAPTLEGDQRPDGALDPASVRRIDHDAALARAMAGTRVVLALHLSADAQPVTDLPPEREAEILRLLERDIRADLSAEPGAADRQAALRRLAASAAAHRALADDPALTLEGSIARAAPGVDPAGAFLERGVLERAYDQATSWRALLPALQPEPMPDGPPPATRNDEAPRPEFARAAVAAGGGAGFVDARPDPDGAVRFVDAIREAPVGRVLQFGLAAAAAFEGVPAADVRAGETLRIGERAIPLSGAATGARMLLDWPDEHQRFRDRAKSDQEPVSIGWLVSGANQRAAHERNARRLSALLALLLGLPEGAPADAAALAAAREQAPRRLAEFEELVNAGETLTEEESALRDAWAALAPLAQAVQNGAGRVAAYEERLAGAFGGRLVFVGFSATGATADFYKTVYGPRTPGVVVHAVAADMGLTGRAVRLAPALVEPALTLLLGATLAALGALLAPAASLAAASATLALFVGVAGVWLFNRAPGAPHGLALPLAAPLLAGATAWTACTAMQAALALADRRRIERQFKARVSGQLVDFLVENPGALSMTGEQREITTLFADLAGFTTISEKFDGPTTVATLNRCMREMTAVLTGEGAYVNKFLGDGLMAFWSAFGADPDQARKACRAAVRCRAALDAVNADLRDRGLPGLSVRIGVATGTVVVGDCGAPPELNDYTVIGNAVNLAARLESANKQFGTHMMIDGRTRELLGADAAAGFTLRPLGRVVVVGQSAPVEVHELLPPETDPDRIALTRSAVEAFQRGDFPASAGAFASLGERFGDGALARVYADAIDDARAAGAAFDGAVRLRSK